MTTSSQTHSFPAGAQAHATQADGEPKASGDGVNGTSVRRFFSGLSLAQRGPEAIAAADWNGLAVDSYFMRMRKEASFTLNASHQPASDGVVSTVDAFKAFKWD